MCPLLLPYKPTIQVIKHWTLVCLFVCFLYMEWDKQPKEEENIKQWSCKWNWETHRYWRRSSFPNSGTRLPDKFAFPRSLRIQYYSTLITTSSLQNKIKQPKQLHINLFSFAQYKKRRERTTKEAELHTKWAWFFFILSFFFFLFNFFWTVCEPPDHGLPRKGEWIIYKNEMQCTSIYFILYL